MHKAKTKIIITAAVYATLLGISAVHADTAAPGEPAVAAADSWASKLTPSY
jgi:hypothetical protein